MKDRYPQRIVCLTEETTETFYILGQEHRIVGVSCFTKRPPQAKKEKPIVSAFIDAKIDDIIALKPDLVLGFSDIQANIASQLVKEGVAVSILNHRSVEGILDMVIQLGAITGCLQKAENWVLEIEQKIKTLKSRITNKRPVVYFEEWDSPIITGIQWVSELIEIAGGISCFPEFDKQSLAKNRIVANPVEIIERKPDIIMASWCGKKFKKESLVSRDGWNAIPAIQNDHIYEIESSIILQPGPAALTAGLDELLRIISLWEQDQKSL